MDNVYQDRFVGPEIELCTVFSSTYPKLAKIYAIPCWILVPGPQSLKSGTTAPNEPWQANVVVGGKLHIKEDTARKLPERGILKIPPEEIAWKDPEAVFRPMPNQPTPGDLVHVIFKPSDPAMATVEMGLLCTANPPYLIWIDRLQKWVVHYDTTAFRRASSASIPLPWVDNTPVGCIPTIKWQHLITIPVQLSALSSQQPPQTGHGGQRRYHHPLDHQ